MFPKKVFLFLQIGLSLLILSPKLNEARNIDKEKVPHKEQVSVEEQLTPQDIKEPVTPPQQAIQEEVKELSPIEHIMASKIPRTISKHLTQFGYEIFRGPSSTFAPVEDVPVGPDYIIGPGDNLIIYMWGRTEDTFNLTVNRNGEIFIPKVGTLHVWGLTFSQVEKLIQSQLSRVFSGFEISITMGKLRSIKVFVMGEVLQPGGYTVSSLSTLFNALYVAGGPTKKGSMRRIEFIRDNKKIDEIDLYRFLLKGDKSQDYRLQSGDTIFVHMIGPVVGIAGDVRRPAIYEMKGNMTLLELINLAGGILPGGDLRRVQVERIVAHEKKTVVDLDLSIQEGIIREEWKTPLQDGDIVKVFPISPITEDIVYLKGHVKRPGWYELKKGMKIRDLILSFDELLPEPYLNYAEIIRLSPPDLHEKIIPFNLGEVLKGNEEHNLTLQPFDTVKIYPKLHFEEKRVVNITGEVRNPGEYKLVKGMKISTLIHQAGGLTKDAYLYRGELIRALSPLHPELGHKIIPFDVENVLSEGSNEDLKLEPLDTIRIYSKWDIQDKPVVSIEGEVRRPGEYPLVKDMRIRDLVFCAGGLKEDAYLKKAELIRSFITEEGRIEVKRLEIDLEKAMKGDEKENILLQRHDSLKVHVIPEWRVGESITIIGEVLFPGTYMIRKGERLSEVLERAGGFTKDAFLKGAVFTRKSVRRIEEERIKEFSEGQQETLIKDETQLKLYAKKKPVGRIIIKLDSIEKLKGSESDIVLEDGDTLFIPKIPSEVIVLGEVYNPGGVLYKKGKGIHYYLNKVGGLTEDADKDEIHIVKASGEVLTNLLRFRKIERGDVIIVPKEFEKKIEWGKVTKDVITVIFQIASTAAIINQLFK